MGSAVSSIVSGVTGGVGQAITGRAKAKAAEASGEIQQKGFIFNAEVDEANADILRAATGRDVKRLEKQGKAELSAQQARIGASGITAESFGLLTSEGVMNLEQDVQDFQLERDVQDFNLRSSARFKRLQGAAAKAGAKVEAELTKVGTAFSIIGGASQTTGNVFGSR
jgi:hypothetical protein